MSKGTEIQCVGGVYKNFSMWGPLAKHFEFHSVESGAEAADSIVKWKDNVDFMIKSELGATPRSAELQREISELFFEFGTAAQVRVTQNKGSYQNVLVVVTNDITKSESSLRGGLRSLLFAASGGMSQNIERMLDLHHRSVAEITPRCHGSEAHNDKEGIVGAFVFVQADQDLKCAIMAIAAAFGLRGAHNEINGDSPQTFKQRVLAAVSELYDPSIIQGMKKDEVISTMRGKCK